MTYEGLSRDVLVARIEALEAERRASTAGERLLDETRQERAQLERQNASLKSANQALEAALAQHRDLFDSAPIAYLVIDASGVVREVNARAAAMLGLDRQLVTGHHLESLARFEDVEALRAHLTDCTTTLRGAWCELRFTTAAGFHEVQAISAPVDAHDGKAKAVRTALMDIRALKLLERDIERARAAECELRTRQERVSRASLEVTNALAMTGENILPQVVQVTADQCRDLVAAQYAAIGFAAAERGPFEPWTFSGFDADTVMRVRRAPQILDTLAVIGSGDRTLRLAELREHPSFVGFPDGHPPITSFLSAPVRCAGRSIGTLYVANKVGAEEFSDADARALVMLIEQVATKIQIAGLVRRERRRHALLDSLSRTLSVENDPAVLMESVARLLVPGLADVCAIATPEPDGTLRVRANAASSEEMLAALACGATLAIPDSIRGELFAEAAGPIVHVCQAADEGPLAGPCMFAPLRSATRLIGVLLLARYEPGWRFDGSDVRLAGEYAHRVALACENAALHTIASRALRARDEMLAFVTHEMGNFLNSIVTGSAMLARTGREGERRRGAQHVESIRHAAERLSALLDTLRDAATMEAGCFRVDENPDEIRTVLVEAAATLRSAADARQIRIEIDADADLPWVSCDRERIHQVLANLIGNAVKHTPDGGVVTVGASLAADGMLRVWVADMGPGIGADDVPHLFQRYWRKGPNAKAGTGLGLFIAHGIVEAHGGTLSVGSNLGGGAVFSFTLRLATGPGVARASQVVGAPEGRHKPQSNMG